MTESARRLIRINARRLTGADGRITDKGYGDLAHELFHAVQRGTAFFRRNCAPPNWITEGMAEAIHRDQDEMVARDRIELSTP